MASLPGLDLPEEEKAALKEQLLRAPSHVAAADVATLRGQSSPEGDVRLKLQFAEAILALSHRLPNDDAVQRLVDHLKPSFASLETQPEFVRCNVLFQLWCFRRVVLSWERLQPRQQEMALKALKHLVDTLPALPQYRMLRDVAYEWKELNTLHIQTALRILEQAAIATPPHFLSTNEFLTKRCGRPEPDLRKTESTEADELGGMRKRPRVDLVNPVPAASEGRIAAPPPQVRALGSAAPSVRHAHPCRSQYHDKFSGPDKHASDACPFCNVCHMMEFLFNGCRRDCCWRHFPTARKIQFSLSRFPSLKAVAQQRLLALEAGSRLDPVDV